MGFYVHICACAHTSIHAPSRGKVLEVTAGESRGEETEEGGRGVAEEGWHDEGVVELIPESNVQREEDGERRGVVSRNVGTGEAT